MEQTTEAAESVNAAVTVRCTRDEYGAACALRCSFAAGLSCGSTATHPYKADGGTGQLFLCRSAKPGSICAYYYDSVGDSCWFVPGIPLPLCSYEGRAP